MVCLLLDVELNSSSKPLSDTFLPSQLPDISGFLQLQLAFQTVDGRDVLVFVAIGASTDLADVKDRVMRRNTDSIELALRDSERYPHHRSG